MNAVTTKPRATKAGKASKGFSAPAPQPVAAAVIPASDDLLGLCQTFEQENREWDALYAQWDDVAKPWPADVEKTINSFSGRFQEMRRRISAVPAVDIQGIAAKARALKASYIPGPNSSAPGCEDEALALSLIEDITALAAGPVPVAPSPTLQQDAALIAECTLFDQIYVEWLSTFRRFPEDDEEAIERAGDPLRAAMDSSIARMVQHRAASWAGIAARFRTLWLEDEDLRKRACAPYTEHFFNERMNWALHRDIARLLGLLDQDEPDAVRNPHSPYALLEAAVVCDEQHQSLDGEAHRLGLQKKLEDSEAAAISADYRFRSAIALEEAAIVAVPSTVADAVAQLVLIRNEIKDELRYNYSEGPDRKLSHLKDLVRPISLLARHAGVDLDRLGVKYFDTEEFLLVVGKSS